MAVHSLNLAGRVTTAADLANLPYQRIEDHDGIAHVFVTALDDLTAWQTTHGGTPQPRYVGLGVTAWTLTLAVLPNLPVRVHALALDTDQPTEPDTRPLRPVA